MKYFHGILILLQLSLLTVRGAEIRFINSFAEAGDRLNLDITLSDVTFLVGLQFEVTYPVALLSSDPAVKGEATTDTALVDSTIVETNAVSQIRRVVVYSPLNSNIANGIVVMLPVNIYPTVTGGIYDVTIDNIVAADVNGDSVAITGGTATITVGIAVPEVGVSYEEVNIADGDNSPSASEGTSFGSQEYTSGSVTRTFRVSNMGGSTLSLGIASSSSSEFSVSGLSSSIEAGSYDDFTVTFDPSSVGPKTATISFSTNDDDEDPFNFDVSGVGEEPVVTDWFAGASEIQPEGWLRFDWFKGFKPEGPNWIYHGRHGWLYVIADDTSSMFLWDVALGRWMFTNATIYPWMYAYGPNEGWVFFFEGGSPGSRFFRRGDNGQTVSEAGLSAN